MTIYNGKLTIFIIQKCHIFVWNQILQLIMNFSKLALLFFSFLFTHSLSAQLEKNWAKPIPVHNNHQYISYSYLKNDQIRFNVSWLESDEKIRNHFFYVANQTGEIIWSFDWKNRFPDAYRITLFENEHSNALFFEADHLRWDSLDYIGVLEPFQGITWVQPVGIKERNPQLLSDEIVYISNENDLVRIDDEGTFSKIGLDKAYVLIRGNEENKLILRNEDQLFSFDSQNNKMDWFDSIPIIPTGFYSNSSIFNKDNDVLSVLSWGLDYSVHNFGANKSILELPYFNNSFVTPFVLIDFDQKNNLYVSAIDLYGLDNHYPTPFLLKFDEQLNLKWTFLPPNRDTLDQNPLLNMFVGDKELVYTTPKSIVQINSSTGLLEWEVELENEKLFEGSLHHWFNDNFRYHSSLIDLDKEKFYTFSRKNNQHLLTEYTIKTTSVTDMQSNQLIVYPNPFVDELIIQNFEEGHMLIYDLMGVLVGDLSTKMEMDLSFLNSGCYLIVFLDENARIYAKRKFIKI